MILSGNATRSGSEEGGIGSGCHIEVARGGVRATAGRGRGGRERGRRVIARIVIRGEEGTRHRGVLGLRVGGRGSHCREV